MFIEHSYLYDKDDVKAHPAFKGRHRKQLPADDELVSTVPVYHSPAEVIEGWEPNHPPMLTRSI